MKIFYCVILLCAFSLNTVLAQTAAEKARMREDKKLLDATKKAYTVPENKTTTPSSTSTTKSSSTTSGTNSGGYVGGPNTAAENVMKGVFSDRVAKAELAEQQKKYGKRNAYIEEIAKKYPTQMRLTYKYMKSQGIKNMERNYVDIRRAAVASGISSTDAETIFYAPNPGLGGIDHIPYYQLVKVGTEAEKEMEIEGKERKRLEMEKEKAERFRLATNYPNRLNLLKAAIEKSGIPLTPNYYLQLRKLAQFSYFTTEESEEIFPFDETSWGGRPKIYLEALPISPEFLAAKRKQKLAKEEQDKRQYEYERASAVAKAKEDAMHGRDLIVYTEHKKKGLQTKAMVTILKPTYDSIGIFYTGFAVVASNGKTGLINKSGEEKIAPQYKHAKFSAPNRIVVSNGKKYGVVDTLNKVVAPFNYDEIYSYFNNDSRLFVKLNKKLGVLDSQGNIIIPFKYTYMVQFADKKLINVTRDDKKNGMLDFDGKEVVPVIYDELWGETDNTGLYKVRMKNKWGFIHSSGKEVIPVIYDKLWNFIGGKVGGVRDGVSYIIDSNGNETRPSN